MLVAWSAIRSRCLAKKIVATPRATDVGSCSIPVCDSGDEARRSRVDVGVGADHVPAPWLCRPPRRRRARPRASSARQLPRREALRRTAARPDRASSSHALRHVDGQIADAFEIGDDLERGGDEAEVGRGGLIESQDADALLVDRQLHLIDRPVGLDDPGGEHPDRVPATPARPRRRARRPVRPIVRICSFSDRKLGSERDVDVVSISHGYPYLPVT